MSGLYGYVVAVMLIVHCVPQCLERRDTRQLCLVTRGNETPEAIESPNKLTLTFTTMRMVKIAQACLYNSYNNTPRPFAQ